MIAQAAKGFSVLMIVRILSRVIDFVLNILVLRNIDPKIYGLTTHLGLLSNFSLFYLKVCLKQAYQRRVSIESVKANQETILLSARNMMIFGEGATSLITPVITLSIAYLYGDLNPYFAHSCVLHGIAALIEGAAEPLAVQFVLSFNYAVPAQAETIAVFIKTLALYLLCITAEMQPLLAFGYSQIVFSSLYALIIYWHSSAKLIDAFCPTKISKGTYIQPEMKTMGGQFTLMALMKFMLQEMEKIVVVAFRKDDIKVSAEFSLVSHIGAFVPRFLYSPIEEVSYNLFSKLSSEVTHTKDDHEEEEGLIGKVEERKTQANALDLQSEYLYRILKIMNAIGVGFLLAGTTLSHGLLVYVYGEQWGAQSCVITMQAFCVYEWLMGLNGISESFVNGNLKHNEMAYYRFCLIIITGLYIFASLILVNLGAVGIIIANCISMVARIALSFSIIARKLHSDSAIQMLVKFRRSLPSVIVIVGYVVGIFVSQTYTIIQDVQIFLAFVVYFGFVFALSLFLIKKDIAALYQSR